MLCYVNNAFYAVPCFDVSCRVLMCRAVSCCALCCRATLSHAMLCRAVLCHVVLCCAVPCHVSYAMPCCAILSCAVLCFMPHVCVLPCRVMLCCAMLWLSVPCHAMPCFDVLGRALFVMHLVSIHDKSGRIQNNKLLLEIATQVHKNIEFNNKLILLPPFLGKTVDKKNAWCLSTTFLMVNRSKYPYFGQKKNYF